MVRSNVTIKNFNDEKPIEARVDTGATHSSIHGQDIKVGENTVQFKFGDYTYKFHLHRYSKVRTSNDATAEPRPIIRVDVVIDGKTIRNVEFNVNDRDDMKHDILIGRSTLAQAGILIDPAVSNIDGLDDKAERAEGTAESGSKEEE